MKALRKFAPSPHLFSGLALALAACSPAGNAAAGQTIAAQAIPLCEAHWAATCIVDGDTIHLDGAKIRLEDIDAPETHPDQYKCVAEKALGDRATLRLQQLLSGVAFTVRLVGAREHDRYGRELRTLFVNGRSVGQQLVTEGLAHEWVGHKLPWC